MKIYFVSLDVAWTRNNKVDELVDFRSYKSPSVFPAWFLCRIANENNDITNYLGMVNKGGNMN